jgi:hypothetical protein
VLLEADGFEALPVELTPLPVVHLHEWRVADDLPDAAARLGARHGPTASLPPQWNHATVV